MRLGRIAGGAYVALFTLFVVLPVYWTLLLTLGSPRLPLGWRSFVPHDLTLDGYSFLTTADGWLGVRNSFVVALVTSAASIAIGVPAAYSIARLPRRGGHVLLGFFVVLRLLPPVAVMLPAFLLVHRYHLRDTLYGLVVFYTPFTLTFTVWLVYGFFRQVPRSLEEAALVDGCTTWQALRRIAVPLAAPAVVAAAALAFVFSWTEFFIAFVFFNREALTLPLHISYNVYVGALGVPPIPPLSLCIIGLLPTIAGGVLIQRYLGGRAKRLL
jgi:multiple sugar transport system permease protein